MKIFDKNRIKACVQYGNPITQTNPITQIQRIATWEKHGESKFLFIQFTDDFIELHRDFWEGKASEHELREGNGEKNILMKDITAENIENAYLPEVFNACPQETGWLIVTVLI